VIAMSGQGADLGLAWNLKSIVIPTFVGKTMLSFSKDSENISLDFAALARTQWA